MCALVVNLLKNFVSRNASAMLNAERYLMAWARAITTRLGKSATSATNLPVRACHKDIILFPGITPTRLEAL